MQRRPIYYDAGCCVFKNAVNAGPWEQRVVAGVFVGFVVFVVDVAVQDTHTVHAQHTGQPATSNCTATNARTILLQLKENPLMQTD